MRWIAIKREATMWLNFPRWWRFVSVFGLSTCWPGRKPLVHESHGAASPLWTPLLATLVLSAWLWVAAHAARDAAAIGNGRACLVVLMLAAAGHPVLLAVGAGIAGLLSPALTGPTRWRCHLAGVVPATLALALGALVRALVGTQPFAVRAGLRVLGTVACVFAAGVLAMDRTCCRVWATSCRCGPLARGLGRRVCDGHARGHLVAFARVAGHPVGPAYLPAAVTQGQCQRAPRDCRSRAMKHIYFAHTCRMGIVVTFRPNASRNRALPATPCLAPSTHRQSTGCASARWPSCIPTSTTATSASC